jgi:OCT family organic cation transporter-like MFS transporter 18
MISFTAAMTALLPKPVAAAIARIPADFWLLYGNVALYALCFQLQQPTQLYLVKSLVVGEAAAGQFAWLKTVNGVLQLAGSLLSGILIDRFGIRAVFVLSLVASALSYALVALPVDDVRILFLAQLPTVLQHAVLAARAYVSLNASPAERAVQLGYVGVAYGVGMVAGPALGGVLGSISLRLPAALATVGSLVSIALLLAAPAHSHKHGRGEPERSGAGAAFSAAPASGASVSPQQPPRAGSAVGAAEKPPTGAGAGGPPAGAPSGRSAAPRAGGHALSKYGRFFTTPLLRARLGLKLLFSAAMALFYSVYQLVAADRFGLDAKGAGYLMSFIGVLGAFNSCRRELHERAGCKT